MTIASQIDMTSFFCQYALDGVIAAPFDLAQGGPSLEKITGHGTGDLGADELQDLGKISFQCGGEFIAQLSTQIQHLAPIFNQEGQLAGVHIFEGPHAQSVSMFGQILPQQLGIGGVILGLAHSKGLPVVGQCLWIQGI